jgi:hypothetical protein
MSDTVDGFDPRRDARCTPFGLVVGPIPMGTLAEVAGKARADEAYRLLRRHGLAGRPS